MKDAKYAKRPSGNKEDIIAAFPRNIFPVTINNKEKMKPNSIAKSMFFAANSVNCKYNSNY